MEGGEGSSLMRQPIDISFYFVEDGCYIESVTPAVSQYQD